MRKLFFILFDERKERIFTIKGKTGFRLPQYSKNVNTNVSFKDPSIFNRWFRENYGIKVYRRYAIDSTNITNVYFILDKISVDKKHNKSDTNWMKIDNLEKSTKDIVLKVLKDYNLSHSMPWIKNGYENYINWAIQELKDEGVKSILDIKQIKNTYVSTVFCFITDKGDYYYKIISLKFIREISILKDLIKWNIIPTVWVVSIRNDNLGYLMRDMGGYNLEDNLNQENLEKVIILMAKFQKFIINSLSRNELNSYYDLSISAIINELENIPEVSERLLKNSKYQLTLNDKKKLLINLEKHREICDNIDDTIPHSIDHADFRPGNIRINKEKNIIIYDWAWSTYTHPFFTLNSFLHIIRRNELVKKIKPYLLDVYFKEWTDYSSLKDIKEIYMNIEKLTSLYYVVLDSKWLGSIIEDYPSNNFNKYSADGWLIDRRQYYYSHVLNRIINM